MKNYLIFRFFSVKNLIIFQYAFFYGINHFLFRPHYINITNFQKVQANLNFFINLI